MGASLFSKNVGICSVVGRDYDIGCLRRLGINMNGLRVLDGKTPRFLLDYSDPENRIIRGDLGVGSVLCPNFIPDSYFHSKWTHISTMIPEQQTEFIRCLRSRSYGGHISVDTNVEEHMSKNPSAVQEALSLSDMVFLNQTEYREAVRLGMNLSDKILVVKQGSEGARYISSQKSIICKAPKVRCIDPTGAGDVFAGVFLAVLSISGDEEQALRQAVDTASRSVEFFGVDGLLDDYPTQTFP